MLLQSCQCSGARRSLEMPHQLLVALFAGGFLTGKYAPSQRAVSGSQSEESWAYPERYFADSADDTLRALLDISKRIGCAPAAGKSLES